MLKDLHFESVEPVGIFVSLAQINSTDLSREDAYYERYEKGIYRHDGYKFNGDNFIELNCEESVLNKWVNYGVCDHYTQVLEQFRGLLNDENHNYVIILSTVERKTQSETGGWRWRGWGSYIGNQKPEHEYLYEDKHIDKVYCYHIYEVN